MQSPWKVGGAGSHTASSLLLLCLRFTASALSSLLGKRVERKASPSASRLTLSSPVTRGFHLNTYIQPAASSRCSRCRQHRAPSPPSQGLSPCLTGLWILALLCCGSSACGPCSGSLSFSVHRGMGLDVFLRDLSVKRSVQVRREPLRFPCLPFVAQRS